MEVLSAVWHVAVLNSFSRLKLPRTSPNGDGSCSPETWLQAVDTFPVQAAWSSWKCGNEPQTSAGTSRPGEAVGGPVVYRLFKVIADSSGKCMVEQSHAGQGEWTWWPNASLLPHLFPQPGLFCLIAWTTKACEMWERGRSCFPEGFCAWNALLAGAVLVVSLVTVCEHFWSCINAQLFAVGDGLVWTMLLWSQMFLLSWRSPWPQLTYRVCECSLSIPVQSLPLKG